MIFYSTKQTPISINNRQNTPPRHSTPIPRFPVVNSNPCPLTRRDLGPNGQFINDMTFIISVYFNQRFPPPSFPFYNYNKKTRQKLMKFSTPGCGYRYESGDSERRVAPAQDVFLFPSTSDWGAFSYRRSE